ncbi:MAG: glycoside hydrolase family 5 protein [Bacilli bacterium]|jgi:aryl-phospho-beta-D-glucosidase BglC (GH1 family)|nr:glycoside hydrolase family 5 protein [Bacilli bacterium]MDD4056888.1 glycoside hydrolase family 5 protein [Bacilli bacterium]MDY0208868.1 glycoside hydrolase family 5 protein [Bacilli bacterium]
MELKKGINLGGFLSQCVHTKEHYDTFILKEDFSYIQSLGFDHVRLPIDYNVMEEDDGTDKVEGFNRIEEIINWAKESNLDIILDLHKAYGYDFNHAGSKEKNNLFSSRYLQDRFISLWEKIAKRFTKYEHVVFELLNEVVEEDNANAWNTLINRTVKEIRKIASTKTIIYGGILWNSATTVKLLEKPIDENIIFTFHCYQPIVFTHQNAHWMPQIKCIGKIHYPESFAYYKEKSKALGVQGNDVFECGLDGNMGIEFLEYVINEAFVAAKKMKVRLYCGEFGVIDQAPVDDSLRWLQDIVKVFHDHHIGYALWTYRKMDFGIDEEHYDKIRNETIKVLTK